MFEPDIDIILERYDVSADGERFVMIDSSEAAKPTTELIVVLNWLHELERLVSDEVIEDE